MDSNTDTSIKVKVLQHYDAAQDKSMANAVSVETRPGELLSLGEVDHAMTAKMNLLNYVRLFYKYL